MNRQKRDFNPIPLLGLLFLVAGLTFWLLFADNEPRSSRSKTQKELGSRLNEDRNPRPVSEGTESGDALALTTESSNLSSAESIVLGRIVDREQRPVAGLTVELNLGGQEDPSALGSADRAGVTTVTDEDGHYAFQNQPAGRHEVTIQSEDYWDPRPPHEREIRLSPGVTMESHFEVLHNWKIEGAILGRYGLGLRLVCMDAMAIDPGGILVAESEDAPAGTSRATQGLTRTRGVINLDGKFSFERLDERFYYRIRVFEAATAGEAAVEEFAEELLERDSRDALLIMNGISVGATEVMLKIR